VSARRARFLLPSALIALAIGAGCGGGDEAASTAPGAVGQAEANAEVKAHNEEVRKEYKQRRKVEAPTSEEREAKQSVADFYAILGEDKAGDNPDKTAIDSTSFCDLMSEGAIEETIHYAKDLSGTERKFDCEGAVDLLVVRSKREGGLKAGREAKVIGVNAEGDQATATVQFGDGPATSIPLVKEDGEWKLAASPTAG
jgi:hypothetical protein